MTSDTCNTYQYGPVTLTDLTGLYEIRPTKEETSMIKGHAETMEKIEDLEKRIPLDRPEQFLFEMSQVPQLEERIACFIFEDTFKGSGSISNSSSNLRSVVDTVHEPLSGKLIEDFEKKN